jgi:hypothetical protein
MGGACSRSSPRRQAKRKLFDENNISIVDFPLFGTSIFMVFISDSLKEIMKMDDEIVIEGRRNREVVEVFGSGGGWSFDFGGLSLPGAQAIFHIGYTINEMLLSDVDGDGISDLFDHDVEEIVVRASSAQVAAAKAHYDAAWIETRVYGALTFAGIGYLSTIKGAAAAAGAIGYAEGKFEVSEHITNILADSNYWVDYAQDGRWDGYVFPTPHGPFSPDVFIPFSY